MLNKSSITSKSSSQSQSSFLPAYIKEILSHYSSENPGVISNLCRILMHGNLSGTGKLIVLPVDQGFEHGPISSFASNVDAFDPEYHIKLAINANLSAYAAPLGMLEAVADKYPGAIPLILKMNSANNLSNNEPDQAITASVKDALRLGCAAIGLTIYPGSSKFNDMIEKAKDIISEAKSYGLATIIWSYPRGSNLNKEAETAVDIIGYATHIAALIGANIIKVKLPTEYVHSKDAKDKYLKFNIPISSLEERVKHIKQCAFNNKRIVLFSGGASKDIDILYEEINAIKNGGGNGSIIGRNIFQRKYEESIDILNKIINIYK